jgi:hypothetical protein
MSKNVKLGIVLPQTTTMLILVQLLAEFYLTGKTEGIDILGLKPRKRKGKKQSRLRVYSDVWRQTKRANV